MIIKLNRGPMKNRRVEVQDGTPEFIVEKMDPTKVYDFLNPLAFSVAHIRGSYRRSNVVLKDGTVVFEWMGWYG